MKTVPAPAEILVDVDEFKSRCAKLLEQIEDATVSKVSVLKSGETLAVLTRSKRRAGKPGSTLENWNPFAGLGVSVRRSSNLDLSDPAYDPLKDGFFHAALGVLTVDEQGRGIGLDGRPIGHMRDLVRRERARLRRSGKKGASRGKAKA